MRAGNKGRSWTVVQIAVSVTRTTPALVFVSETKMVANAWLRPGNTAASSNCEAFVDETFEHSLGGQQVALVPADSGFYTEKILNCQEAGALNYIDAVRCYPNSKRSICGLQDWV